MIKGLNNKKLLLLFILFGITTYLIFLINKSKEGFIWSNQTKCNYETYIKNYNPSYRFNINKIQQQATQKEIEHLLKYNEYPWNENTKKIFLDYVSHNNVIKTEPYFSLKKNQSIYPESVILKKLGFNTKEGKFILNGSILPSTEKTSSILSFNNYTPLFLNEFENPQNIAVCKIGQNGKSYMEQQRINDECGLNTNKKIENKDIEKTIPGFKFVNGICNPCSVLDDNSKYNCPFTLNKDGDNSISPVWKILWNI
jgi:hypothetical protein